MVQGIACMWPFLNSKIFIFNEFETNYTISGKYILNFFLVFVKLPFTDTISVNVRIHALTWCIRFLFCICERITSMIHIKPKISHLLSQLTCKQFDLHVAFLTSNNDSFFSFIFVTHDFVSWYDFWHIFYSADFSLERTAFVVTYCIARPVDCACVGWEYHQFWQKFHFRI